MNNGLDQKELLVAWNKEQCSKICSRILQMLAKQGATYEESWKTISLENTRRTVARDQY